MKNFFAIAFFAIGIITVGQIQAQATIQVAGQNDGINFIVNSYEKLEGTFEVSEFKISNIGNEEGEFTRLSVPGYTRTYNYGGPEMPAYRKLLSVPLGASAKVEIIEAKYREFKLEEEGFP